MDLYAIILLTEDAPDPLEMLKDCWAVWKVVDHRIAFVGSDDPNETTGTIAAKVGISAEGRRGIVVRAEDLSGYGPAALAEWIGKHRD